MFKRICFIFCFSMAFFQQNLQAQFMTSARGQAALALLELSTNENMDSVRGWEVQRMGEDEATVRIFMKDGSVVEMHCENLCHEVSHISTNISHSQSSSITMLFMLDGSRAAQDKWRKTLSQRPDLATTLGTLESYKVWVHEESGRGHDVGVNLWTKLVFANHTYFIMCHAHGSSVPNYCHYRKSPAWEPDVNLEGHEEHDHHDEHEHHDEEEHHAHEH